MKYPNFERMKGVFIHDNEHNTDYMIPKLYQDRILTYKEFLKLVRYIKNLMSKDIREEIIYDKE